MEKVWNSKLLHDMIEASGMTHGEVAKACGIRGATFENYVIGSLAPSLDKAWKMADYFGVSLDEFVGRVGSDAVRSMNDKKEEMLRGMEAKLGMQAERYFGPSLKKDIGEWPYNLLKEIFGEWDELATQVQIDGIEYVLSLMPQRWRICVYGHYRDGRSYNDIGKEIGVTRERVRQILTKVVRKMRGNVYKGAVLNGPENAKKAEEVDRIRARLANEERELREMEAELALRKERIDAVSEEMPDPMKAGIEVLDLPVRADNALRRGIRVRGELVRLDTVEKVVDCARAGRLMNVRNLGAKTAKEICAALENYMGVDYSGLNTAACYNAQLDAPNPVHTVN